MGSTPPLSDMQYVLTVLMFGYLHVSLLVLPFKAMNFMKPKHIYVIVSVL